MTPKCVISHSFGMADHLVNAYVGDLTDEEILMAPVQGMNHIAWQLGHLISTERAFIELISPGASPALPTGFDEVHSRTDTKGTNPSDFLKKDDYLALYKAQREVTSQVLDGLADADLDKPTQGNVAQIAPTFGTLLNLIALHYLMHVGQFVAVRRSANKPIAV